MKKISIATKMCLVIMVGIAIILATLLTTILFHEKQESNNSLRMDQTKESYTVIENEPFYSKTTYYFDESEAPEYDRSNINVVTLSKSSNNSATFLAGVRKEVVVGEFYKNGAIIESRLLTADEIAAPEIYSSNIPGFVGYDTVAREYLTLDFVVLQSFEDYIATGYASWNTQIILGGEELPDAAADDFMIINWGGDGELKASSHSFTGEYHDGTSIQAYLDDKDSYEVYSWYFREKLGAFGSTMRYAEAEVIMSKTYPEVKDKETNIKFTYVHTYDDIVPEISFSVGYPSGFAGNVNLSTHEGVWKLTLEVPGILY